MKKTIALAVALAALPVLIYLVNPYGTATQDVRARILGYVPYRIPSVAMSPTLQSNDFILVSAVAYMMGVPEINDIVVFKWPKDQSIYFVMRVMAKGGDVVSMTDGQVVVNGNAIDQSYVDEQNLVRTRGQNIASLEVPPDNLLVFGDNRDNSNDSRYWGFVPAKDVVGKVKLIWNADDKSRIGFVE